jgi:hypothetical protein
LDRKSVVVGSTVALVAIGLFCSLLASGAIVTSQTVTASGLVASGNLGIYSDYSCTQTVTSINWGTVAPGGSIVRTVYLKNSGTVQVTLSMTKANWNPTSANGPITVTWDRENTVLTPNQVVLATVTLSLASTVSGISAFNVDIVFSGST